MPDLSRLATWLRCPICGEDLVPVDELALGCVSGHRHDVNKRGYVNLLGGRSAVIGDSREMLDARDVVLENGAYSPIADAVSTAVDGERVLDAGAGTGYYLRSTLARDGRRVGLALDLSPVGVARATRSSDRIDGVVADTWRPLPVRTATTDAVLDIFAPRNLPEFHRTLRASGVLVVVVPRPDHLGSLRAAGTMLDIPSDKADDVITLAEPLYAFLTRESIAYDLALTPPLRDALAAMGPSARHAGTVPAEQDSTRVSVDVLRFRRR